MDRPCGQSTFVMSQCHWDLRGLGGKCVCVAPCHWGARNMLAETQRVAGERDHWWYRVICLLLVCGGPLQRCADTARNAPRLALLSHNVALPFHLHIDVYTPSTLYTHRHRYTTHRHTQRPTHLLNTSHLTPNTQLTFYECHNGSKIHYYLHML